MRINENTLLKDGIICYINCRASDILHNRYSSYNQPGLSKSLMDTNYLQDDLSCSRSRDFDSVSVCSTASSSCSRDRRSPYMHGTSGQLPSPGSISNKISVSWHLRFWWRVEVVELCLRKSNK